MKPDPIHDAPFEAALNPSQRKIEAKASLKVGARRRRRSPMEPRQEVDLCILPQAFFWISETFEVGLEPLMRRSAPQQAEGGSAHMPLRRRHESVEDRPIDALYKGSETALCSTDDAWGRII
jgi:hypothetical protein